MGERVSKDPIDSALDALGASKGIESASVPANSEAGKTFVAQALELSRYPSPMENAMFEAVWEELLQINPGKPVSALYSILTRLGAPIRGMSALEQVSQHLKIKKISKAAVGMMEWIENEDSGNRQRIDRKKARR